MYTVNIVPASEEDLDTIIFLGENTRELQINEQPMYYSKEALSRAIHSSSEVCLVAKIDNKIAGFFLAHINDIFEEIYISDVVVKEEYRGQGIGQKFMEKVRELLKNTNIDWSWALVQEDNTHMHRFMEKQGYIKGKKFFFFYKPVGF